MYLKDLTQLFTIKTISRRARINGYSFNDRNNHDRREGAGENLRRLS